jgi:hypothetical protein
MKKIEAPYLLFALIFGFMALFAPYLMEEHRLTLEGRVAMLLFQAAMVFACALATAKHLHDKWVQEDIQDRQARLRVPRHGEDTDEGAPEAVQSPLEAQADRVAPAEAVTPHTSSSPDDVPSAKPPAT